MMVRLPALLLGLLFGSLALCAEYLSHQVDAAGLHIRTSDADVSLRFLGPELIEAAYAPDGRRQLPSFTLDPSSAATPGRLEDSPQALVYDSGALRAVISKQPFRISYYRGERLLVAEEVGLFHTETLRGFRFRLEPDEKLMGGGQRVLGMDRRGHRLPLYNRAHYGYSTESDQMYFSLPAVISDRGYLLLFDNSASGHMDLGSTEGDVLQFEAAAGRTAYLVASGDGYPALINNYIQASGRPPLPPRWALGNFASRFGYRNEAEARDVVRRYREQDIPLDAIVLDLYWFGPDIKGHMGNLDWDRQAWPQPERMLADFQADGVQTILVTEPFILTTSKRWQEAVDAGVLARSLGGGPRRFDFYFGNTGLIDVFHPPAAEWFWNIYRGLMQQGVAGWWGDLGEPEVHPHDSIHALGTGDELHNAYGHEWARLVYEGQRRDWPQTRPFIMMRSGAPGSQRYGMIPWTGDVDRSWGGLQSQVELALQMGLFGFGWIHSDLGGFAGGERFDRELYIRWLQYGVFQPVYRPHAQEHIAPEPVFHDRRTRRIVRDYIRLRYALLPYNYTLAWQHSRSGMPLMRPLFFEDAGPEVIDRVDAYLWGDAFLVSPVVKAGTRHQDVLLPEGVWFDYWSGARHQGAASVRIATPLERIPLLVRAGSFVPMIEPVASTRDYSSGQLSLHYYADSSVSQANGLMYEDDGHSFGTDRNDAHELLRFAAHQDQQRLRVTLQRQGGDYEGRPEQRAMRMVIHNWPSAPASVSVDSTALHAASPDATASGFHWDPRSRQLQIAFDWVEDELVVAVE